jgi:hypothetical protein
MVCLLVGVAVTRFIGLAPSGSFVAAGLAQGLRDTVLLDDRQGRAPDPETPAAAIEFERNRPDPDLRDLSRYLAQPGTRDRPVVFYGQLDGILGKRVGVVETIHATDSLLFGEIDGPEVVTLLRNGAGVVVMERAGYERLFGLRTPADWQAARCRQDSAAKGVLGWLSSGHYAALEAECRLVAARWDRTVGDFVRAANYQARDFGAFILMEPGERDAG